jgi:GT2 family glycosyltransferase
VSIIVPTRNRGESLAQTLESIGRLKAGDIEVIVVDTGGGEETRRIAEEFRLKNPEIRVRYFVEGTPSLLAGRHRGVEESDREVLAFIDDDVKVDPDWLTAIIECFRDPSVHLVGGRVLPLYEVEPPDWIDAFWHVAGGGKACGYLSVVDLGMHRKPVDPMYVWGVCFAVRRSTLREAGGFHPDGVPWELRRYRGDGETAVSRAIAMHGLKAVYEPRAMVQHVVPKSRLSIEYFEQRAFLQGISDSFSQIRMAARVESGVGDVHVSLVDEGVASDSRRLAQRIARRVWRGVRRIAACDLMPAALKSCRADSPVDQHVEIRRRVELAHRAGVEYHQREVEDDPELLAWVLRNDYWDYGYPPGAARYFPRIAAIRP